MTRTSLFYTNVPSTFMRKDPCNDSEVVSETYFSEEVTVFEERGPWALIETTVDSYRGWVLKKTLCAKSNPYNPKARVSRLFAHIYLQKDIAFGPFLTLPFSSKIHILSQEEERFLPMLLPSGKKAFIQRGDIELSPSYRTLEDLPSLSVRFLDLPYTWGGRTSFGYDCSGFTQMLYREIGVFLPRDAKDQILWKGFSQEETDPSSAKPGDLLFWGTSKNAISHVGMCLEKNRFIHATAAENAPYIRISDLDSPYWNGSGKLSYVVKRSLCLQ